MSRRSGRAPAQNMHRGARRSPSELSRMIEAIVDPLLEALFGHAEALIGDVQCYFGVAIASLYASAQPAQPSTASCPICLDQHVRFAVLDVGSEDLPHIPSCPCCAQVLGQEVINSCLDRRTYEDCWKSPWKFIQERRAHREMKQRLVFLFQNTASRQQKRIRCPSCPKLDHLRVSWVSLDTLTPKAPAAAPAGRGWFQWTKPVEEEALPAEYDPYHLQDAYDPQRCECSACGAFCSHCLASPYHYGVSCNMYPKHQQAWKTWRQQDEGGLLVELMMAQSKMTKEQAEEQLAEMKNAMKESVQQLMQDEDYKAANCRHCPNCQRVIEKTSGCNAMLCGQNFHGGAMQQGCGHRFNWEQAQRYQPRYTTQEAKARSWKEWWQAMCCDHCNKAIQGPRTHCLNCPSVDLCLACTSSMQKRADHPTASSSGHWVLDMLEPVLQYYAIPVPWQAPRRHIASHTCQVILQ